MVNSLQPRWIGSVVLFGDALNLFSPTKHPLCFARVALSHNSHRIIAGLCFSDTTLSHASCCLLCFDECIMASLVCASRLLC